MERILVSAPCWPAGFGDPGWCVYCIRYAIWLRSHVIKRRSWCRNAADEFAGTFLALRAEAGLVYGATECREVGILQDSNKTKRQLIDELTDSRRRVSELESGGGRPSDRSELEEKYQDLYDNAPDMFVSIDPGTATVLQCNGTVLKKLGYSKDEMIGRSIFDLYHPDCIEDVAKAFQSFRQTGEVRDVLLQLLRKDGRKIEVALNA